LVAGLDGVNRPPAIGAQALGKLVERAARRLGAVDVRALELLPTRGGQRLFEGLERLRLQVLGEPLRVALAGDAEALGWKRRHLPSLALGGGRLAHEVGARAEVVERRLARLRHEGVEIDELAYARRD